MNPRPALDASRAGCIIRGMALPTARLVAALRDTAARLRAPDVVYKWSHFGHCNCGHLAQTITGRTAREIYRAAVSRSGDWGEQAHRFIVMSDGDRPALDEGAYEPDSVDLCGVTGAPVERVLAEMIGAGLDRDDIDKLEDLSDGEVLRFIGASTTGLQRNERADVIRYLEGWASLLESRLSPFERARARDLDSDLPIAAEE